MVESAKFFHGRKLTYEIYVQSQGRWQLRQTMDDGREPGQEFTEQDFERVEKNVIKLASSFLSVTGVESIKVVRERENPNGSSFATEIYRRDAPPKKSTATPKILADSLPLIETADDLSTRPVARGLSVILREFLNQTGLTALECLHHNSVFKRINANDMLYQSLVHQVATKQVEVRKISLKTATQDIHRIFDTVQARSRTAAQDTRYTELSRLSYPEIYKQISSNAAGQERRFQLFTTMTRRLEGSSSPLARLALALQACEAGATGEMAEPVDELVANCLDDPQFVMDMLGNQPSLAAAVIEIAHFAEGSFKPAAMIDKEVIQLAEVIGAGLLPLSKAELWSRVVRTVQSGAVLMRKDPSQEAKVTRNLAATLKEMAPPEIWRQMVPAVARRIESLKKGS